MFDLPRFIFNFAKNLGAMKKQFVWVIGLIFLALTAKGQGIYHHPNAWFAPPPGADKYYFDSLRNHNPEQSTVPGIRYNINVGTSFTSGGYYGNTFQTWISPEIQIPVSERFSLRVGAIATHINATNMAMNIL